MRLEAKSILHDVREACTSIAQFTGGMTFSQYVTNPVCRSAVERQFIIVGEALNRLGRYTPELLENFPESRSIISFRNVLVHGYDQVEDEVVWGIVQRHVPGLLRTVTALLEQP